MKNKINNTWEKIFSESYNILFLVSMSIQILVVYVFISDLIKIIFLGYDINQLFYDGLLMIFAYALNTVLFTQFYDVYLKVEVRKNDE